MIHIEGLEKRELLSSSFPNLLGYWSNSPFITSLSVSTQKGGRIFGYFGGFAPEGQRFHGTVNGKGRLQVRVEPLTLAEVGNTYSHYRGGRVVGQVTGNVISGIFRVGRAAYPFTVTHTA